MYRTILGIGNALVDIIARIEPSDIKRLGLVPGSMTLVDGARASEIYEAVRNPREVSGGSAANTIAIAASLGAKTEFIGKIAHDALGQAFVHDLKGQETEDSVAFADPELGLHTGHCLSLITPDGQRTMCTHLGAAQDLEAKDVKALSVLAADIVFLEGYLLDAPRGYDIFQRVANHSPGCLALTLSDARCVERHIEFLTTFRDQIDLVFGNAEEMRALLYGAASSDNLDAKALTAKAAESYKMVVCTDGPNGVYFSQDGVLGHVPAVKATVVDTTGAGDSLAGTILWALAHGLGLEAGARHGVTVAAEVISEIGARPSRDIRDLVGADAI